MMTNKVNASVGARNSWSTEVKPLINEVVQKLNEARANMMSNVRPLVKKLTNFDNSYAYVNDTVVSNQVWKSAEIEVVEADVIFFGVFSSEFANMVTFLDASNNILGSVLSDEASAVNSYMQTGRAIAPASSVKAVITTTTTGLSTSYYAKNLSEIAERLTALETAISELDVENPQKGVFDNEAALVAAYPTPEPGWSAWNIDTWTMWGESSGSWVDTTSSSFGDMLAATYDPTGVMKDAFDLANMVGGLAVDLVPADGKTISLGTYSKPITDINLSGNISGGNGFIYEDETTGLLYKLVINNGALYLEEL